MSNPPDKPDSEADDYTPLAEKLRKQRGTAEEMTTGEFFVMLGAIGITFVVVISIIYFGPMGANSGGPETNPADTASVNETTTDTETSANTATQNSSETNTTPRVGAVDQDTPEANTTPNTDSDVTTDSNESSNSEMDNDRLRGDAFTQNETGTPEGGELDTNASNNTPTDQNTSDGLDGFEGNNETDDGPVLPDEVDPDGSDNSDSSTGREFDNATESSGSDISVDGADEPEFSPDEDTDRSDSTEPRSDGPSAEENEDEPLVEVGSGDESDPLPDAAEPIVPEVRFDVNPENALNESGDLIEFEVGPDGGNTTEP